MDQTVCGIISAVFALCAVAIPVVAFRALVIVFLMPVFFPFLSRFSPLFFFFFSLRRVSLLGPPL